MRDTEYWRDFNSNAFRLKNQLAQPSETVKLHENHKT